LRAALIGAFALSLALTFASVAGASSTAMPIITKVRLDHGRLPRRGIGAGSHGPRPAIVGGNRISILQAPWQATVLAILSETEGLLCGGSILNETEVLTAGHCAYDPNTRTQIPADRILVIAGTADLAEEEPGEEFAIASSVRVHPYYVYNPEATQPAPDDVAVVQLEEPLSFTEAVQPISLTPAGSLLQEGTAVELTGFGEENPVTEELNGELHAVGMNLGFSRECGGEADALFLCASTPTGSPCFGDSGSALTVPGPAATLVGVTDTGEIIDGRPCVDGAIGGFANVAAPEIRDFITEDAFAPPRAPRGGGVSVQGVPVVGNSLSCKPGAWSGSPAFTYMFENSDNRAVLQAGASPTYQLSSANLGQSILCEVQASNAGGTGVGRTPGLGPIEEEKSSPSGSSSGSSPSGSSSSGSSSSSTSSTPAPAGTQEVAGFQAIVPAPVPDAQLASTALTASLEGTVSVKVSCPAGETSCSGTVTLHTLNAVSASFAGTAKSKGSILTLATGSFTVAGGKVTTVELHLSARARALLARAHALRARATVVAHDPAGVSHTTQAIVTLRAAKAKHGKG
jgi:hypothetical protein